MALPLPDKAVREVRLRTAAAKDDGPQPKQRAFKGNRTSTTKYNLLTFLPKALFEQYRRVANVFFTLMVVLSLLPFSPVRPWTTITPLVIVVGVSVLKEAREDYKRYRQDREVNSRAASVLSPAAAGFVGAAWAQLRVGDVVRVTRDEQIPADLVFLASSAADGCCYVETMNLDGETNLKIKAAPDATRSLHPLQLPALRASVECEGPNARLYHFTGNLRLAGLADLSALASRPSLLSRFSSRNSRIGAAAAGVSAAAAAQQQPALAPCVVPLSASAVLLRGCTLRNTASVYGVVVYAGHESKIFMNATQAPSKRSSLERIMDIIILLMFATLLAWSTTSAVVHAGWTELSYPRHWYLRPDVTDEANNPNNRAQTGTVNFFVALLLYSYLVPISLYVSVEMVKVVQSMVFIANDREMYDAATDTPARARTSNLNEELGMVGSIMTDKTGTLTCNVMEFFKCSIAGVAYGAGVTEVERSNAARKGVALKDTEDPAAAQHRERFFNFYDKRLMGLEWAREADPGTIEMFFRLLAVCHTVIPDGLPEEAEIKYEAESPDEAALVVAAKAFGFFFHKRTNTTVVVRERTAAGTADVEYEVLNVLEFNSTRKRMSVVIRDAASGRLLIFTKGADTVIYERLDPSYGPNAAMKESTSRHMEEFGSAGLRTLCLSYAEIDREWYDNVWQPKWTEAKTSLEERDAKLAAVGEEIERNLRLLGCTAIEDKLQDQVPQCIKQLALAGIRIWVLTGDKMETAINIGFACSLLTEDMHQFCIGASCPDAAELAAKGEAEAAERCAFEHVERQLHQAHAALGPASASGGGESGHPGSALVIDGNALSYALSGALSGPFLDLGLRCKAVVCCRVSPLQKAQVTALVRRHRGGGVTLAIGDGANDVGMIQKAHIGVGISGQEGMQAAMSADFAIAQFRFLVPLLLVHGHWSYVRLTRMINYFFYKNVLFGLTLFVYSAFAAFSGSYLYNDTSMTLYNVLFTSAVPIAVGVLDRPVGRDALLRHPQLYRRGVINADFNARAILGWLTVSVLQALVVIGLVLGGMALTPAATDGSGLDYGMPQVGVVLFSCVIVTVHAQLAVVEEQWTWLHHVAVWGSLAMWWVYLVGYGWLPAEWSLEMRHLFMDVMAASSQYWMYTALVPLAAVLPCYGAQALSSYVWPTDDQIIREMEKQERNQRRSPPRSAAASASEAAAPPALSPVGSSLAKLNAKVAPFPGRGSVDSSTTTPYGYGPASPSVVALTQVSSPMGEGVNRYDMYGKEVPYSPGMAKPSSYSSSAAAGRLTADALARVSSKTHAVDAAGHGGAGLPYSAGGGAASPRGLAPGRAGGWAPAPQLQIPGQYGGGGTEAAHVGGGASGGDGAAAAAHQQPGRPSVLVEDVV